jgi:hypothetical protein
MAITYGESLCAICSVAPVSVGRSGAILMLLELLQQPTALEQELDCAVPGWRITVDSGHGRRARKPAVRQENVHGRRRAK